MSGDELSAEIQRLKDIEAIKQLKAFYCRCVDTKDWDGYATAVTDDITLDTEGGLQQGRDTIIASLSQSLASAKTVHQVHVAEITVDGDSAHAIFPMQDYVNMTFGDKTFTIRGFGQYHEDYARTSDGWKLHRSKLVRLHVETEGELPSRG
ncbi:MAG TPA: nuclear transport factor 2 family protein [Acidimicrobiales bacterium]